MDDVTVVVATFGAMQWVVKAGKAATSARRQSVPAQVVIYHGDTLHDARNQGANLATTEWLVFLDADDGLDPHYIEAMLAGDGDLRQPATLGMYDDGHYDDTPVVIPAKASILDGNWMVIGTMVRREMFLDVGGFRDLPAWEDWDLWIRCIRAGATLGVVPEAIYRVGVNAHGRNSIEPSTAQALYSRIREEYR